MCKEGIRLKGVTLIEVLFVIAIVAIVMLPLTRNFRAIRVAWESGDKRAEIMQNGRIGMDKMERELKHAKGIDSVTASSDTNGQIVFTDINDNTATFKRFQSDGLYWLGYDTGGTTEILAGPVDNLRFTCYEEDGITETTKPRAVKSIKIEMVVSHEEGEINPETFVSQVLVGKELVTLAINEIMYDPPPGYNDDYYEFVELYNFGGAAIDVDGWLFKDRRRTDTLEGDDVYGSGSTVIPSGGYAVITDKDTRIYTEIVQNGGFESANLSMWIRSNNWSRRRGGHSGRWRIQRNGAGWIYQEVSIPSQARSVSFSCWEKTPSNPAVTRLIITVRNTGGAVIETLYDGQMSSSWTQHTADLSAYIGRTGRIYFETGSNGQYRLDDISIIWSLVDKDAIKLRVDDNAIGNGLSNSGERLTLQIPGDNGQVVDTVLYSSSWGGAGNGDTIERIGAENTSDDSSNWRESQQAWGTPGFKNDATP